MERRGRVRLLQIDAERLRTCRDRSGGLGAVAEGFEQGELGTPGGESLVETQGLNDHRADARDDSEQLALVGRKRRGASDADEDADDLPAGFEPGGDPGLVSYAPGASASNRSL